MLATPAISVLAAAIRLGERPGAFEIAGMLLIAAALALLSGIAIRQHRRTYPLMGQE
jgi:drug/metabolite transporter (DMT)-like permease